jgi:hypothetical protein
VQKLRVGAYIEMNDPLSPIEPPEFHRAFLEINNTCKRDCWFCGFHGIKRSFGCFGCNKWKESGTPLAEERWKEIMGELHDLRCKEVFVIGGDLTLNWSKTLNILNYAYGKFKDIYISLHQQSTSPEIMNDLSNEANVIIQCDDVNSIRPNNSTALLVVTGKNWERIRDLKGKNIIKDFTVENATYPYDDLPIATKKRKLFLLIYSNYWIILIIIHV